MGNNEAFLPVQAGVPFPPTFRKGMRVIYKRLFRIYAHVFHSHFQDMMEEDAHAHLKHSFKHFIYFVKEFDLIDNEELDLTGFGESLYGATERIPEKCLRWQCR